MGPLHQARPSRPAGASTCHRSFVRSTRSRRRRLAQGKIKSLEQIYLFSMPVKEYQIVEHFLGPSLKDEVMKIMPVQKQTRAGQRTRFKVSVEGCKVMRKVMSRFAAWRRMRAWPCGRCHLRRPRTAGLRTRTCPCPSSSPLDELALITPRPFAALIM